MISSTTIKVEAILPNAMRSRSW